MRATYLLLGLTGTLALASLVACGVGSGTTTSTYGTEPSEANYAACVASIPKPEGVNTVGSASKADIKVTPDLLAVDTSKLDAALRDSTAKQMRSAVAYARYQSIVNTRCSALQPAYSGGGYADAGATMSPSASSSSSSSSSGGSGAAQVSTTNNQVAGVDEADIVKNDTRDIIVAAGSTARILRSWPAADTREISRVTVEGKVKKLFLTDKHLVVYSALSVNTGYGGYDCSYGYGCDFGGDGTGTLISVFDVTDREHPKPIRSLRSTSSLIAARRIGNVVHTVLAANPFSSNNYYSSYPTGLTSKSTEDEVNQAYDTLLASNEARIKTLSVRDGFPRVVESDGTERTASLYQSQLDDGGNFTTLTSFDLENSAAFKAVTVISKAGAVYASADAVYMAVPHNQSNYGWYDGYQDKDELSTVHKFRIGASPFDSDYVATGVVEGRVLNQFSMDQYEGNLRIATTTGHLPSPTAHNTLTVLGQEARALKVLGKVENIAPSEDIRSVRFEGDRGYMVTFKKTDPLYVFDLKTATAPKILGELKIPGFSTYMHRLDATHLLTIGYDADDQGSFAYFNGVLLQIFDVTDASNPTLAHKLRIGTRGSSSEALANHLAFNYFEPKGVLAIPMTICEGGGNGQYGTNMTFSGLQVYDVSVANGIKLRGQVAHPSPSASGGSQYNSGACSNWWANASSEVKRSVFMDDFVYSISDTRMKVNGLNTLSTDVKEIKF